MIGVYTVTLWTPQLVKLLVPLYSNAVIGLLVVIPNFTGLAAMILVSRNSDRTLERRLHVAIPLLIAAAALLLLSATRNPFFCLILLSVLAAGAYSYTASFWALPNQFLTGYSAAAAIALLSSAALVLLVPRQDCAAKGTAAKAASLAGIGGPRERRRSRA